MNTDAAGSADRLPTRHDAGATKRAEARKARDADNRAERVSDPNRGREFRELLERAHAHKTADAGREMPAGGTEGGEAAQTASAIGYPAAKNAAGDFPAGDLRGADLLLQHKAGSFAPAMPEGQVSVPPVVAPAPAAQPSDGLPVQAQQTASGNHASQLADRMARQFRRILASEDAAASATGARVMLKLDEGPMSGTQLWLSRDGDGWQLDARSSDAGARHSLIRTMPLLAEQFDSAGLGPVRATIDGDSLGK